MVMGERFPVSIIFPLCQIVTLLASKCASQPWSHSFPVERSELCLRALNMCASAVPCGISGGMGRMIVYVQAMAEPSGRLNMMHWLMGVIFVMLLWACK
jgi:hypothetical protein